MRVLIEGASFERESTFLFTLPSRQIEEVISIYTSFPPNRGVHFYLHLLPAKICINSFLEELAEPQPPNLTPGRRRRPPPYYQQNQHQSSFRPTMADADGDFLVVQGSNHYFEAHAT